MTIFSLVALMKEKGKPSLPYSCLSLFFYLLELILTAVVMTMAPFAPRAPHAALPALDAFTTSTYPTSLTGMPSME